MRSIAWLLLLAFTFTIPWENSLNLGPPLGNAARIAGLVALAAAILAIVESRGLRRPGAVQWLALALFLWFCCTLLWTIDRPATFLAIRASFQEFMVVWLIWEFAETPADLRSLLRVFVAGSWVLALLTLANFSSPAAISAGQYRFAAYGQDPNDVARLLDLGFPLAALLANSQGHPWLGRRWPERILAVGYLPLGLFAVLLTASRSGFLAAIVAFAACGVLLARGHARVVLMGAFASPAIAAGLWLAIPAKTLARLATIPQQLSGGNLNERVNIWWAGWHAFARSPILGTGAGTFVAAAGLSPIDTAHNTALSLAVSSGLIGLTIALVIFALVALAALRAQGELRIALVSVLAVWAIASLTATIEHDRTTWFLFGAIYAAARMAVEDHIELAECFPDPRDPHTAQSSRGDARVLRY